MRGSLQIWAFAIFLFVAGLALFTRSNGFPFYYHSDEPVKVKQVQTEHWNFNHPMLMLTTARLAVHGKTENPQHIVEVGRTVSATFAAGAVALFAGMMWVACGRFAGIATGLLLLTHHQLFELAHYFKEDTALLFGMSVWLLGLALYVRSPGWCAVALTGLGAALAMSGKYIGVFAPIISIGFLLRNTERRGARLSVFLGVFVGAFALINLPLLLQLTAFESSFHREIGLVVAGQRGMTRSVPHSFYLNVFRDNLVFPLWAFVGVALWKMWKTRRERTALEWLLFVFPLVYLLALSFSPKTHDRYFLPATALFVAMAAWGMREIQVLPKWRKAVPALLGVIVLVQVAGFPKHDLLSYWRAFQTDDRRELAAWLNANHPDAVIAQDRRALLSSQDQQQFLPHQPLLKAKVLNDSLEKIAGLDALRDQNVTLAALCQDDFGRYDVKSLRPQRGAEEAWNQAGAIYRALREGRTALWERPRGLVIYLHPGLKVYSLPEAAK